MIPHFILPLSQRAQSGFSLYELSFETDLHRTAALRLKLIVTLKGHTVLVCHKDGVVLEHGLEGQRFAVSDRADLYTVNPDMLRHRHADKAGKPLEVDGTGGAQKLLRPGGQRERLEFAAAGVAFVLNRLQRKIILTDSACNYVSDRAEGCANADRLPLRALDPKDFKIVFMTVRAGKPVKAGGIDLLCVFGSLAASRLGDIMLTAHRKTSLIDS